MDFNQAKQALQPNQGHSLVFLSWGQFLRFKIITSLIVVDIQILLIQNLPSPSVREQARQR